MQQVITVFLLAALISRVRTLGSCRDSGLCCPGRDSSCVVQKTPINAIIEDLSDKPCYCDHACLKLGDCCVDFKQSCGVVDCVVSEWGPWSACDSDCGTGMMTRHREIIRNPENGGKHCPSLIQKRGCHGDRCQNHQRAAYKEIAFLLPAFFSDIRRYNETHDIRKNLKLNYPNDPKSDKSKEYCVQFEIVKMTKGCSHHESHAKLDAGSLICVACETEAFRKHLGFRCKGHGIKDRVTRWGLMNASHCNGKWVQKEVSEQCPCSGGPQFIFV